MTGDDGRPRRPRQFGAWQPSGRMAAHAPLTEYAVHRHHIRKWLRTPEIKHQVGAEGVDGRAGPTGETTYQAAADAASVMPSDSSQRSASMAALQPSAAAVTACRYRWSWTSPAMKTPSILDPVSSWTTR